MTHPYVHPQHMEVLIHHMCLTLMWEPSWMGLQSQLVLYAVVCFFGGNSNTKYRMVVEPLTPPALWIS
jgi:hypothetical protein